MTRYRSKKLVLGLSSLGIVAAVAALAIGGTMALFSSQASPVTSTYTAGYMTLTGVNTTPVTATCNFTDLTPGGTPGTETIEVNGTPTTVDVGTPVTCDYTLTYAGKMNAYILLDVKVDSGANPQVSPPAGDTSPLGGETLMDGSANGLQVTVLSPAGNGYPAQVFDTPSSPTPSACSWPTNPCTGNTAEASNQLFYVPGYPGTGGDGDTSVVSPGWTDTIQIQGILPQSAGNQYENGSASVTVSAEAVQSANNHGGGCGGDYGPCSVFAPVAQSVAVSATSSQAVLSYNEDVYLPAGGESNFIVQDISQPQVGGSYDQCPVSSAKASGEQVTLTWDPANCTGQAPSSGDLFDITYYQSSSGNYLMNAAQTVFAEEPQAFFNQVSS